MATYSKTYSVFPAYEGSKQIGWTFGRARLLCTSEEHGAQWVDEPEPGVRPALSMGWALEQAAKRNESVNPELAAEQRQIARSAR